MHYWKIRGFLSALLAATVGLAAVNAARAQAQSPPGYFLIYHAAGLNGGEGGGLPDGNLSNSDEWFEPVTGTPYENVPQSGDDAIVSTPGMTFVYGGLSCWGAGITANDASLSVDASVSTGDGGLALASYGSSDAVLTLYTPASTSGGFL